MRENPSYHVGAAASAAGVNVQTLHYYERRGLIQSPGRSPAGYREYGLRTVRRVRSIKRAQGLGFTLGEIRELMDLVEAGRPVSEVAELARAKLEAIDEKIEALVRMRDALRETMETCRCGGDLTCCDIVGALAEPGETR